MKNKPIIFIVGSTASGKTSAAISLAQKINGEIICADSQTIRKGLNIGTAKPDNNEQGGVKHYLLDIIEPYDNYNVSRFKLDAQNAIKEIKSKDKVPIVVGGTGLYIDSLYYDYSFSKNNLDRSKLEKLSVDELKNIVRKKGYIMPKNENNPRHLIGVIARGNDNPKNKTPIDNSIIFGIRRDDEILKKRIYDRVENMFNDGFVDEVKLIIEKYGPIPERLDAIGYPIVQKYLNDEINLLEAKKIIKTSDWQYAKRQKTWFKRNKYIQWFTDDKQLVRAAIKELESH